MRTRSSLGMITSEYAVGIIAACTIAGCLIGVFQAPWLRSLMRSLYEQVLGGLL